RGGGGGVGGGGGGGWGGGGGVGGGGRWREGRCEGGGVGSVGDVDVEGMVGAAGQARKKFCLACFTGDYPLPVDPALDKFIMEKREARSKALVDQERHPTLFADLK